MHKSLARIAAGIIAVTAVLGEALFFEANRAEVGGSAIAALQDVSAYLTDWSNTAAAIVFGGVALGVRSAAVPRTLGAVVVALTTVGAGYAALGGWDGLADKPLTDILTHAVTPWLSLAFWLAFVRPGQIGLKDAAIWTLPLVVYWTYAFTRGGFTGDYAYPFIDVTRVGWASALGIAAGMTALAALIALVLVGVDRVRRGR